VRLRLIHKQPESPGLIFWIPAGGSHSPKEGYQATWVPPLGSLPRTGRSIRIALRGNLHANYENFISNYIKIVKI